MSGPQVSLGGPGPVHQPNSFVINHTGGRLEDIEGQCGSIDCAKCGKNEILSALEGEKINFYHLKELSSRRFAVKLNPSSRTVERSLKVAKSTGTR
ncbi:unnamed protein product [Ceratitis capitata]|uniref:(Mediterranean fruit fly) hypothetical protein n=1 Tax=Ceratitis capitata TaxID=7213 RepID=A0A811VJA8_CERCA|nr:unnamed protein product [Ceratitis capitata]